MLQHGQRTLNNPGHATCTSSHIISLIKHLSTVIGKTVNLFVLPQVPLSNKFTVPLMIIQQMYTDTLQLKHHQNW